MESNQNPGSHVPPPPRPRRLWLSVLMVAIVFSSGLAIGGSVIFVVLTRHFHNVIHHPEQVPARLSNRLASRLSLSADQQARVREIIARHQEKILHIRREAQPRVEIELRGVHDDVAAVLDPVQCKEWNEMYSDFMKNWVPKLPPAAPAPVVPTTTPFPNQ